jgi:hypothetical protein
MFRYILCLLSFFSIASTAMCLPSKNDTIANAAKWNAKHFSLSDSLWKQNKHHRFPITSDYFKPACANVTNIALLNDSAYVQAFRYYAFKQNKRRRTAGHHILVGVEIAAGIAAAALIAIIIFVAPNME